MKRILGLLEVLSSLNLFKDFLIPTQINFILFPDSSYLTSPRNLEQVKTALVLLFPNLIWKGSNDIISYDQWKTMFTVVSFNGYLKKELIFVLYPLDKNGNYIVEKD